MAEQKSLKARLGNVERNIITNSIIENGFELTSAASELGISRATLYRKLTKEGLNEVNQLRRKALAQAGQQISDFTQSDFS